MRRILAVGVLAALLLSGCGEADPIAPAVAFRAELVRAGGCSFTAEVTADSGDAVDVFTLRCDADGTSAVAFEVVSPETLGGITATVSPDGGTVTYDGMAMDFGLLAGGNVIPAAAPALAVFCWREAYIAAVGTAEDRLRVTYEKDFDEKQLTVDTDFKNGVPIFADMCYNGQSILRLTIEDFSFAPAA